MAGQLKRLPITITAAADGLSNEVDISHFRVVGLHMPADWTAATITVKARPSASSDHDDVAYNVYDSDGNELTLSAAEDRMIVPTPAEAEALNACAHITLRSGTSATPVQQAAARTVLLVCEPR